jgi:penicillin-binding protein 1C
LSPEAAYVTTHILAWLERPDLPQGLLERSQLPRVAWKTGTSFGRRDAWAIGYTTRHVIGVWLGNMDGRPVPTLSGAASATPLLMALFNSLENGLEKTWFQAPSGVERRIVCPETGLLPGPGCTHGVEDLRIRGRSDMTQCAHIRTFYTNENGTERYCPACLPAKGYQEKKYATLDAELLGWMQRTGKSVILPPAHAAHCTAKHGGEGPAIISPKQDGEYWVEAGQSMVLQANCSAAINHLYWFVNDQFVGATTATDKLAFTPTDGQTRIACMDDMGQKTEVKVTVRYF